MAKKKVAKKPASKKAAEEVSTVTIPPVEMAVIHIPIKNLDGSLVVHNWSEKAIAEMLAKQMGQKVTTKAPKSPQADFKASVYVATDGTYGFPVRGFKAAMVRAAKAIDGLDMIAVRQLIFVLPDCEEDREFTVTLGDGSQFTHRIRTPLVRILGEPQMRMDMVRLGGKTADIRFRAEFPAWEAILTIRYPVTRITPQEIANLANLAGNTVGIGEGRPEKSTDMGWGRWEVDDSKVA